MGLTILQVEFLIDSGAIYSEEFRDRLAMSALVDGRNAGSNGGTGT